jgi:hypothetical protein
MTLIITFVTYDRIIQASDRRLTWPNGRVADDEANKAVGISCKDACFSIAYTGVAIIDKYKPVICLVHHLTAIDAAGKKLIPICKQLDSCRENKLELKPGI